MRLLPEQRDALDQASTPALNFPAAFLAKVHNFAYGGTTINGQSSEVLPMVPKDEKERY